MAILATLATLATFLATLLRTAILATFYFKMLLWLFICVPNLVSFINQISHFWVIFHTLCKLLYAE